MRSKSGGDGGTGAYMREGTTSRVTAADRPYGEFYGFYRVSPENFGSTHVLGSMKTEMILYTGVLITCLAMRKLSDICINMSAQF